MIQIEMDMPMSCSECPLMYDYLYCPVTSTRVDLASFDSERLANCPLHVVNENEGDK